MKENGIMVDFEWAYNQEISSPDLKDKSPVRVKEYVEGWREGYLSGFLIGYAEATIKNVCRMKRVGMSSELISRCTSLSLDAVSMITAE
jgi:hypothetical protein